MASGLDVLLTYAPAGRIHLLSLSTQVHVPEPYGLTAVPISQYEDSSPGSCVDIYLVASLYRMSNANGNDQPMEEEDLNHQIVVLDNGAYTIKAGFAGHDDPKSIIPNCIAKSKRSASTFVGEQTETFSMTGDMSQLNFQRPFERGYLNDWEIETQVWDHLFSEKHLDIEPNENSLMFTEPLVNPDVLQQQMNEVVFETYGFQSCYRATSPRLAAKYYSLEHEYSDFAKSFSHLVVDSGYSWTTVTPVFDEFNINFSQIEIEYKQQGIDVLSPGNDSFGWNLSLNAPV